MKYPNDQAPRSLKLCFAQSASGTRKLLFIIVCVYPFFDGLSSRGIVAHQPVLKKKVAAETAKATLCMQLCDTAAIEFAAMERALDVLQRCIVIEEVSYLNNMLVTVC